MMPPLIHIKSFKAVKFGKISSLSAKIYYAVYFIYNIHLTKQHKPEEKMANRLGISEINFEFVVIHQDWSPPGWTLKDIFIASNCIVGSMT